MAEAKIQRNTQQRQVILEELRKLKTHPTAAEIYAIVRERLPKISLGTVYRNLELLARNKVINKLDNGGSEARFDGDTMRHSHIRCVECGQIGDMFDNPTENQQSAYTNSNGYEILGFRTEYYGVCPKCRDENNNTENRTKN
jgi:Fur family ferric uptake transcriptional regulator